MRAYGANPRHWLDDEYNQTSVNGKRSLRKGRRKLRLIQRHRARTEGQRDTEQRQRDDPA